MSTRPLTLDARAGRRAPGPDATSWCSPRPERRSTSPCAKAPVTRSPKQAIQSLRDNTLQLDGQTLVVVDEAGMVGTDDLRQLLTATTAAGVKTVLVGDAHQLAPVKARGGMFAQLCTDLPWTQHLSEVWRMRDPAERAASLALRDGGPAPVRRAIDWYRTHDRLHTGDPIAMAHDALFAYWADTPPVRMRCSCVTRTEMADALNERIHGEMTTAIADCDRARDTASRSAT